PNDDVTCFYCGNILINWSSAICSTNENIVQLEHARFFPCRFIIYTAGIKFVAAAGYFQTVSAQERRDRNPMTSKSLTMSKNTDKPQTIDECLATFDTWPQNAPISAQVLADTGFYYLGEELRVKCFMCDLEVDDWCHGMTAIGTHRKRKNDCEIVRAIDSIKTGDIQTVNEKWRLETLLGLSFTSSNINNHNQTENEQHLCCELAACGFYRFKNTKYIRCAYCGVTIEPKFGQSIMSQHRYLTKQSIKTTTNDQHKGLTVDCLMVRAKCPANIVISHRERFPEYPRYQSIFDRIDSFKNYKEKQGMDDYSIRDRAEAGFFFDEQRRTRCFQCGNALPISDKIRRKKYSQYNMAQLHAHFFPTCEWVKEILGVKYIAQVLHDQQESNQPQTQTSFCTQASSILSPTIADPASTIVNYTCSPSANDTDEPYTDDSEHLTDDEDLELVAAPSTAYRGFHTLSLQSPTPSTPSYESSTTQKAQTCSDSITSNDHSQLTPIGITEQMNQFEQQYTRQQQVYERTDDSTSSDSYSHGLLSSIGSSPVDIRSVLAHESNRLDTFKQHYRETFAQVPVAHLAYVGFFFNTEGTAVQCQWCEVYLTEQHFENIVCTQPTVACSTVSDEPWTPMRVHRYANGIMIDQNHPWCTWVYREGGGLYPNVPMLKSQMLYPEYPSYSNIEKRIKSFTSDWVYPSGSRLSNQMMAQAGFFYMGGSDVCCYYCGNKLQNFKSRDCPFEEHATFFPLCDFIQKVRGRDYVNRIMLECERIPQARLKYELDGSQKSKRIIFKESGATKRKSERPPVTRRIPSPVRPETIDNGCLICTANAATHEYDPCQHCPMCQECCARLDPEKLQRCMHCLQPATIRIRVSNIPLIQ
ncbi:unnamed protein product, partial [Rotaria sordida]